MAETKTEADLFRAHLESLPLWPEFQQDTSSIDGLIPSCKVDSWEKFIEAMRAPDHRRASREMIYRGQRGCNWPLASTLGRRFDGGSIPPEKRSWLLEQFELSMRGRGYDLSVFNDEEAEIEKWAIGQHHGLSTPLLDWTRSPFVALFFAFNRADRTEDNPSRAIFCINMTTLKEEFPDDGLFREPHGQNNTRLVNQAGLFTLTPSGEDNLAAYIIDHLMDEGIVNAEPVTKPIEGSDSSSGEMVTDYEVTDNLAGQIKNYICKIHIPNTDRLGCLDMLRKMNIHNGSLFPDAQGASLYCNDWLDRLLEEEKNDQKDREKRSRSTVIERQALASVANPEDHVEIVKNILDLFLEDIWPAPERAMAAEKLDTRFQDESSIDWQKSPSKTARVRTGLRKMMVAIEIPSDRRDQLLDELLKFYTETAK